MKKLAILGASAALAALPVVGVFAADGTKTVTETLKITVDTACSLASDGGGSDIEKTIANGSKDENIEGSTLTVTCNDNGGWYLNAVGGGESEKENKLVGTKGGEIDSAAELTGSAWAFKVTATEGTAQSTYGTAWNVVPDSATKIVQGTGTTNSATVKATYGVSISATQAADVYTGKVTYTLMHPASN